MKEHILKLGKYVCGVILSSYIDTSSAVEYVINTLLKLSNTVIRSDAFALNITK